MKKKILILLIAVVPFITNAATCNNAVTIKSISQNSSSYEEMELESPTIEENLINVSFKLKNVNDYVQYKITLKNASNKKYNIDSLNINDENLSYEITTNDNNLVLSPNSEKDILLKISYKANVNDSLFKNEVFIKTQIYH